MSPQDRPGHGGYAAWVSWIEAFRRGENPPTDGLGPISGWLGSYVEARVLDRLSVAYTDRVRAWQTTVGDAIVASPPDGPAAASAMLRDAVARLDPLLRLASSPLLPRSLGASMHTMVGQVRDGAQTALDEAWRRRLEESVGSVPVQRGSGPARRTSPAARPAVPVTHVGAPRPRGDQNMLRRG